MTKNHCIRAAEIVKRIKEQDLRLAARSAFVTFFTESMPKFDYSKFYLACQPEDE